MRYVNQMNNLTRAKGEDEGNKGHKDKGHVSEFSSLDLRQKMTDSKGSIRHMLQRE